MPIHTSTTTLYKQNVSLKKYSTFGIGGNAELFAEAESIEEMQTLLHYCQNEKIPFFILGKGSNCLFDDRGFKGMVILNKISSFEMSPTGCFKVGAGYSFSRLGTLSAKNGWSGLEFASGIPGTVGGAVFMNAGANGKETCETLRTVDYMTKEGNVIYYPKKDLKFAYRTSCFQEKDGVILSATFQLSPLKEARERQLDIIAYRKKTQPLQEKSAGFVFQNPPEKSAGALIDACRLKGMKVGGAEVSEIHANFIINTAGATSQEVLELISLIKENVKKETGIDLQSEVRFIPYV